MVTTGAPTLLHVVGYLTGASLYALLLGMVVRTRGPAYRLTLGTALLGLAWNVGELAAHATDGIGFVHASNWFSAVSYAALGLLAAVAVHSAARGQIEEQSPASARRSRLLATSSYVSASIAGAMQMFAAATGRPLPWSTALMLLTVGLAILSPALLLTTRRQSHGRRALWITALALFAVSALHLSRSHLTSESWPTELLGHHASIPLAFAILYQDYRFAFVDLFLKRALTVLVLVTFVFVAWSSVAPSLMVEPTGSLAVFALLGLWIGTALVFPWVKNRISLFVDRVVLRRAHYATLLDDFGSSVQRCASEEAVLDHACAVLTPALSADSVTWQPRRDGARSAAEDIVVPTAEEPQKVLTIGRLRDGRRLLSDDILMLERVALLAGRRIDALRLRDERYERMLREREISTLAAEAELRALRAQINPHFLFNALTTLGYLIRSAPARAVDTLLRLTRLLRSVLHSEGEFTTLGHEQELIDCYLQIERERFEERLDTSIDIPKSLSDISIPSLIVQPLVENAIKHGIAPARDGGRILVRAQLESIEAGSYLSIRVSNTGVLLPATRKRGSVIAAAPTAGTGIGLENVERRLRCYYGDAATLTLSRSDSGETVAELRLPVIEADDEAAPVLADRAQR
jgi:two-component system LytT family sensor kinase